MTTGSPDHEVLRSIVGDLTGFDVVLDPQEANTVLNGPGQISIDVKSGAALGVDDYIHTYDSSADAIVITQKGNRLFTLTVKMESYDPLVHAHEVLETLRIRLSRKHTLDRLHAAGMTVYLTEAIVDLPTTYDNRVISVSAMDLRVALFFAEESTDWLAELSGTRLDSVGESYGLSRNPGESDADYLARVRAAALLDEGNYIRTYTVTPDVT